MSTSVTLNGRLTKDPELRYGANGKPLARFSVVTSRRVKDQQSGEWSDMDTTFWDCVAFGQLAENVAESLAKGSAVIVTGRAAKEEWETKDGQKRRSIKVTADEVAPSLRFASAKISKVVRSKLAGNQAAEPDRWASDGPGAYSSEPAFQLGGWTGRTSSLRAGLHSLQ
jgi:single-strand DNA-binding protein